MGIVKKWKQLSGPARAGIVGLASVDGAARLAAIVDVVKRDKATVRGPKLLWIVLLAVVNSAGLVPMLYKRFGTTTK